MRSERMLLEYVLNAMWQLPLLVGGVAVLLRVLRMEAGARHGVWMGVLAMAVLLPVHGIERMEGVRRGGTVPAQVLERRVGVPVARGLVRWERPAGHEAVVLVQAAPRLRWRARVHAMLQATEGRLLLVREVEVQPRTVKTLLALYGAAMLWALVRVGRGWWLARRLLQTSAPMVLCEEEASVLLRESERLGVAVPEVRRAAAGQVTVAAVVGVWRPVLLVGEAFAESSAEERRAALCHELAHVRRDDGLLQAAAEWLSVPVLWHPAIAHGRWGLKAQLRETREMACDAEAAEGMRSRAVYARCLLGIARRMGATGMGAAAAMGMADGVLEDRVLQLVEERRESGMMRMVRGTAGVVVCAATAAAVGAWHLRPVQAARVMPKGHVRAAVTQAADAPRLPAQTEVSQVPGSAVPAVPTVPARAALPEMGVVPAMPAVPVVDQKSMQRQMAAAQRQMQEAVRQMNSPEFRRQMREAAEAGRNEAEQARAMVNSPEFQRQIHEASEVDTPAFREQVQRSVQESLQGAQAQMQAAMDGMRVAAAAISDGAARREMERAAKEMEQAQEEMRREMTEQKAEAARDAADARAEAARDRAEAARESQADRDEAAREARQESEAGRNSATGRR